MANLAAFIERAREEGGLPIELSDGSTVTCPPALLWPDDVALLVARQDYAAAGARIMGEEQWGRFTADGGNWKILDVMWGEHQGATVGEPSASSRPSPSTGKRSRRTSPGSTR